MHLLAYASSLVAALFFLAAPFSKRHTLPRWLFAFGMLAFAIEAFFLGQSIASEKVLETGYMQRNRMVAMAFLPFIWLMFAASFSRAHPLAAIRSRLLYIIPALFVPLAGVFFFNNVILAMDRDPSSDSGWSIQLGITGYVIHFFLLLSSVGTLVSLERTFRASVGTLRWKIKFMLYGLGTLFAVRFFTSSQAILFQNIDTTMDAVNSVALILAGLLILRSLLRPGNFDTDLYPSKTVLSSSITILLAGGYLILVGVASKAIEWFGGESTLTLKAVVVVLAIVALGIVIQSDRFRQSLNRFVSRNFKRSLYDYREVWLKLSQATTQSTNQREICQSITRLLNQLFHTKLNRVWLVDLDGKSLKLIASSNAGVKELSASPQILAPELIKRIAAEKAPLDIDDDESADLSEFKQLNPTEFPDGGHRIIIPLIGRDTLIGFLLMGDRTNELPFTTQEFDIATCIASQLASTLLSAQLSNKLAETKEVEAFQTMATFFVHDLKNATNTLNLMLKNLPLHWDNPEFREDAIRGIGKTNTRIKNLITRLTQIRHELKIKTKPTSTQSIIEASIAQWQKPDAIQFTQTGNSAEIQADSRKLQSVIVNLLINATEAITGEGQISLATHLSEKTISVSVADTGCGIPSEFIREGLFRPFKTTKNNGLGIGMFQSKLIVEAHGGRIDIESQVDKGTTFTVTLPRRDPKETGTEG